MLLGGFAVLFSLGVISIWRKPALATASDEIDAQPVPLSKTGRKKAEQQQRLTAKMNGATESRPAPMTAPVNAAAPAKASSSTTAVAAVEREVEQNLDGLKDKLFRLELRRQAGTISDEDYLRERTQAEKVLRELVGR
jgi:hypothetical protein